MCTGPWRAFDSLRRPCWGEAGAASGLAGSAKPQAVSELPLGRQRGRGGSPARCSPAAVLVASFAAPGGFLWLPRRGQLVLGWEELHWALFGAWREGGGTAPRNQRPERGLGPELLPFPLLPRHRSPSFPPASRLPSAALQASNAGCWAAPPPPQPRLSQLPHPAHTAPAPRQVLHVLLPPLVPTLCRPHTDERIENAEPLWTSPPLP